MYEERLGPDIGSDLLSSVKYFITGEVKDSVLDCLSRAGAKKSFYLSTFTTHLLVGKDGRQEEISEAEDMLDILAVDQDWVLASAYAGAKLPLEAFTVRRRLFSGLVIQLGADLSETDQNKLWAMVTWHGGSVASREMERERVTHLVTSREEKEEREGLVTVTPNWVVESVKHNQLQDTNSEEFKQFAPAEREEERPSSQENLTENEGRDQNRNPQKLTRAQKTFYVQQQNNLIRKYLASLPNQEREHFYQLDTAGRKRFVFENGLRVRVEDGEICLTESQEEILSRPEEEELLAPVKEEETQSEEIVREESQEENLNNNPLVESVEKEIERDEEEEEEKVKVKQALLNLRPAREETKFVLTPEQEKRMMKMNRQQRHLYLTKLKKQFAANPQQFIASQEEERNALNNIGNLQLGGSGGGGGSPRVRTPQRRCSSSRVVRRDSLLFSPSIKPGPGPGSDSPGSPYVGQSSDKKISGKYCLLGCTFLITGYQESRERQHVGKWRVVIERHGASMADSLGPEVSHVLAPSQDSPVVREAMASGRRVVTAHWLNDIITNKKLSPPWRAVHFPLPVVQQTDASKMELAITGFEDQERDYVKDMIEQAGAVYTPGFTRTNTAIICKAFVGEKYRVSLDWKIPAVSISWLNDVLFGSEDVSQKLQSSVYRKVTVGQDNIGIKEELVSHLLEAWKVPIHVNNETFYKFKEREKTQFVRGKRSLEQGYDQTILTPDRKKVRLDPRNLFEKKSQSKEILNPGDAEKEEEVRFDFYLQRKSLFAGRTFHLMAAVEPSVEVLKDLIENSGGRVEIGDIKTIREIKNCNQRSQHSYIVIAGGGDDVQNLLEENVKIFSSDFVFNSIRHCDLDFQKNVKS